MEDAAAEVEVKRRAVRVPAYPKVPVLGLSKMVITPTTGEPKTTEDTKEKNGKARMG